MYHNLQQSPHYQQAPPNHPRGLILTPSRELADQIYVSIQLSLFSPLGVSLSELFLKYHCIDILVNSQSVAESLCGSVNLKPQLIVGGRGTQVSGDPQEFIEVKCVWMDCSPFKIILELLGAEIDDDLPNKPPC